MPGSSDGDEVFSSSLARCSGVAGLMPVRQPVTLSIRARQTTLTNSRNTMSRQRFLSPPRRLKNISHSSSVYCIVRSRVEEQV